MNSCVTELQKRPVLFIHFLKKHHYINCFPFFSQYYRSHTYQIQEDVILRQYLPKDFLENATGFQPQETDAFIVGYPRAGSTWVSYVLYLLKNGGEPIGIGER